MLRRHGQSDVCMPRWGWIRPSSALSERTILSHLRWCLQAVGHPRCSPFSFGGTVTDVVGSHSPSAPCRVRTANPSTMRCCSAALAAQLAVCEVPEAAANIHQVSTIAITFRITVFSPPCRASRSPTSACCHETVTAGL